MLLSGGQNQSWPTRRRIGYITLAVQGVPNTSEQGTELAVAHKWVDWLHNPCNPTPTLQIGEQNQKRPTGGWIGYITLDA